MDGYFVLGVGIIGTSCVQDLLFDVVGSSTYLVGDTYCLLPGI